MILKESTGFNGLKNMGKFNPDRENSIVKYIEIALSMECCGMNFGG